MKMPTTSLIVSILASLALQPMAASAEQNRFYVRADAGGTTARDVELRDFFGEPTLTANSSISLDPGIRLGIRGGYGVTDWLAAEVETGYTANRIESISGATVGDGFLANVPVLLNAKLHLPNHYRISPYIGAGFGISSTIFSADDIVIGGTYFDGSAADAVFAYQAFAGFRFALNDRMGLSFDYRFFHADPASMTADMTVNTPSNRVSLGRTETHSISVAFDWIF